MLRSQCMRLIADGMSMDIDNTGQYYFCYAENGGDITIDGSSVLDNSDCQYNRSITPIDYVGDMICYTGVYIDRECPLCKKYNEWNDMECYVCNCAGGVIYTYDSGELNMIVRQDFVWLIDKGKVVRINCDGCNVSTNLPIDASVEQLEQYKLLL